MTWLKECGAKVGAAYSLTLNCVHVFVRQRWHWHIKCLSSSIRTEIGHRRFPHDAQTHVVYTNSLVPCTHTLYEPPCTHTQWVRWAKMMALCAITCNVEIKNTDFTHQYFNGSVNRLQDMCCIIKSELLTVLSMSWVILTDRIFFQQTEMRDTVDMSSLWVSSGKGFYIPV